MAFGKDLMLVHKVLQDLSWLNGARTAGRNPRRRKLLDSKDSLIYAAYSNGVHSLLSGDTNPCICTKSFILPLLVGELIQTLLMPLCLIFICPVLLSHVPKWVIEQL